MPRSQHRGTALDYLNDVAYVGSGYNHTPCLCGGLLLLLDHEADAGAGGAAAARTAAVDVLPFGIKDQAAAVCVVGLGSAGLEG